MYLLQLVWSFLCDFVGGEQRKLTQKADTQKLHGNYTVNPHAAAGRMTLTGVRAPHGLVEFLGV